MRTYTAVYTTGSPTTIDYNTYPTAGVPVNGSDMNYVNNTYYYDINRAGSVDATITMEYNGLNTPALQICIWRIGTA